MNNTIPQQVKAVAQQEACNRVSYRGELDGSKVYVISEVDEEGQPVPNGLPFLVLWDGKTIKSVSGLDSLKLLSRLQ